jgi:hypothetical protein
MEKHELSKSEFKIIDDAFNVLLQYRPDPVIVELRNMFRGRSHGLAGDRPGGRVAPPKPGSSLKCFGDGSNR